MKKTIIARLKKRDGFVKEMAIPEVEMFIHIAEYPPMQAYPYKDEELENHVHKKITFKAEEEITYIDYKEI